MNISSLYRNLITSCFGAQSDKETPEEHSAPSTTPQNGPKMISDLPLDTIFRDRVFTYLDRQDLGNMERACREFRALCREFRDLRVQKICRLNGVTELLADFGIACPDPKKKASSKNFLAKLERRAQEINTSLPAEWKTPHSAQDLASKLKPKFLKNFLQTAYNHSLKRALGGLAGVPETDSVEESASKIHSWLKGVDAHPMRELTLSNRGLVCLPREVCSLTELRFLDLQKNSLASLPEKITQLSKLQMLLLDDTPVATIPAEIGKTAHMPELKMIFSKAALNPLPFHYQAKWLALFTTEKVFPRAIGEKVFIIANAPLEVIGAGRLIVKDIVRTIKEKRWRALSKKLSLLSLLALTVCAQGYVNRPNKS